MEEPEKFENLRTLYQELHNSRKDAEAFQNKIAFAFSTILLILAGVVAKGDVTLPVEPELKAILCVVILLAMAIGIAYILAISITNRERYPMIVRVELALGFHSDSLYLRDNQITDFDHESYQDSGTRLLPKRSLNWGKKSSLYTHSAFVWVNVLAVGLSGIVALVAVVNA